MSKFWYVLIAVLALNLTACNDDDENDDNDDYAKRIEGIYTGTLKVGGQSELPGTYDIQVIYVSKNKVTLKAEGININPVSIPSISADCPVTLLNDGKYSVEGAAFFDMAGNSIPVAINGTFDNAGNTTISLGINFIQSINVDFTGKIK